MTSPAPAAGDGAVAGHASAPGPAAAGPGALSQATPRQGVPSGGRVALIPLSATRPIPHGAQQ